MAKAVKSRGTRNEKRKERDRGPWRKVATGAPSVEMRMAYVQGEASRNMLLVGTYVKGITIIKETISGETGAVFWSAVYLSRSRLKGAFSPYIN